MTDRKNLTSEMLYQDLESLRGTGFKTERIAESVSFLLDFKEESRKGVADDKREG